MAFRPEDGHYNIQYCALRVSKAFHDKKLSHPIAETVKIGRTIWTIGRPLNMVICECGSDAAEENRRLCLRGEVLVPHGRRKVHNWGPNEEGLAIAERGLALIRQANPTDRRKEIWALIQLGMACLEVVPARAKQVCDECIRLCHETDEGYGLLAAHTMAAQHFILKDDLAHTWVHARGSHALTRQFGMNRWSLVSLELQTMMKTYEGTYAEAKQAATRLSETARDLQSIHYFCFT